jgi:hypothetical protein
MIRQTPKRRDAYYPDSAIGNYQFSVASSCEVGGQERTEAFLVKNGCSINGSNGAVVAVFINGCIYEYIIKLPTEYLLNTRSECWA